MAANFTSTGSDTFPAGMIMKADALSTNQRTTTTSTSWNTKWYYTKTFTPLKASSNIWLCASIQCYTNSGGSWLDFYKNASDVSETYNLSGLSYGFAELNNSAGWQTVTGTFLDTCSENSTSTKTYSISGRSSGGTLYIGGGSNAGVTLTMMEIAT